MVELPVIVIISQIFLPWTGPYDLVCHFVQLLNTLDRSYLTWSFNCSRNLLHARSTGLGKDIALQLNPASGLTSTVAKVFRANARKIYVLKWNRDSVWKATRKRKSWAGFLTFTNTHDLPYIVFRFYLRAEDLRVYVRTEKLRDSGNQPEGTGKREMGAGDAP